MTMVEKFRAEFNRLNPVPKEALTAINELCESGELFRYSGDPDRSPATLLEREFAQYLGVKYAVAVNSCSSAILLALQLCGVKAGTKVLVPAFTFTAVPSAVINAGAKAVLVETTPDFRMDIDDFRRKAPLSNVLLLSHMRGYMSDLDAVAEICAQHGIVMIEDAAHALGSTWNGKQVGSFGRIGCFSFQSNKIINAGEGGMLTTDDEDIAVKAIIRSGAYETLYRFHAIGSELFDRYKKGIALSNMRLTNVAAAIVRPQLKSMGERAETYRRMHERLVGKLQAASNLLVFPGNDEREVRVPDSLQFRIPTFGPEQMATFIKQVNEAGLPLSHLGGKDNARAFWNWGYLGKVANLHATRRILATTCDMRLPLSLTDEHLDYMSNTIGAAARTEATA
jgi:perosamine synthetase